MSKMFEYIQNQIRQSVNESVENRIMYCRLYRGSIAIDLSMSFPFSAADTKRIADIRFTKSDERLIADCDRMIRKLVKDHDIIAAAFDIPAAVDDPGAAGEKWYLQRIIIALLLDRLQPLVNTMQPFKKRSAAVFDTS